MIDLDAIKARCEAATPGPWEVPAANVFRVLAPGAPHHNPPQGLCPPYPWRVVVEASQNDPSAEDVAFIAHARTDVPALVAEVERLKAYIGAILDHGMTTWSDTSCGRGGAGGQAMTTTAHPDVLQHLVLSALHGWTLTEAADQYAAMLPSTTRLDEKPRPARRAGADGRPV